MSDFRSRCNVSVIGSSPALHRRPHPALAVVARFRMEITHDF